MKRVAVIGASGQVGRCIASQLKSAETPAEILLLSRNTARGPEGYLIFDPERDDWSKLGKLDVLINAAGIIHESKDSDFERVHIHLVQKIIENRNLIGNPRILQVSALGADEKHPIVFLRTKGMADQMLLKQENSFILRPSIICTSNTMLVQKFKMLFDISRYFFNHALLPTEFLKTRIQPVMEEDFREAAYRLCMHPQPEERILNAVGAEEISFKWLMELASKVRNQPFVPVEIPKNLVAAVTKNFISIWFPGLINYDQFQLLFKDNIADKKPMETFLGRTVQSTLPFWESEFRNN